MFGSISVHGVVSGAILYRYRDLVVQAFLAMLESLMPGPQEILRELG